ncbi:hypothetical protein LX16_0942 [Stackebrandtia albiflava]|uniref:PH (Pleckstrin Homology) domain-containing protein n=1 Tax=Stackebrandtia albiflava TaxID=406432 RepID=A0A562VBL2_9ACTN|nr:hypothetical protein [Stackebrandtia albiflava]TWJ15242.1 hypothetical protein LX16_0942 [Stackebrandtia albiflava]
MPGALPIRFRPTPGQAVSRAARVGLIAASAAAAVMAPFALTHRFSWSAAWPVVVAVGAAGAVFAATHAVRGGIVLDETGVRPTGARSWRMRAEWHLVTEIRAERRGCRTVPVVYLASGRTWRLPAPYDAGLLERDTRFDQKLCVIRNLWVTHRSRRPPPDHRGETYSRTAADA